MVPVDAAVLLALIFSTPVAALGVVLSWVVRLVGKRRGWIPRGSRSWVERRWVAWPAAGILGLYALCFAWGSLVEAHWVQVTRVELKANQPVLGYDRFRIVHLSDLHLERLGRREARVVELVRELEPHLVLLTGDYMNVKSAGQALSEMLSAMKPPHGVYGVQGNWDTKFLAQEYFRLGGATLLEDETRLLPPRNGGLLRLVGQSVYPSRPLRDLLSGLEDGAYTIYLHHLPDAVDELRARERGQRVDLFLCGHTHGGQVRLPFWGAVVTESKYHKRYERGLFDVDGVPMFVSQGVGMQGGLSPRVRFLCRPEVAVIDLVYP